MGWGHHDEVVQAYGMVRDGRTPREQRLANDRQRIADYVGRLGESVQAAVEVCTSPVALVDLLVKEMEWIAELAHPGYAHRLKQNPD